MVYCWKCGDSNPELYNFCGQCGAPAQRPSDGATPSESAGDNATASGASTAATEETIRRMMDEAMSKSGKVTSGVSSTRTVSFVRVGGSGTNDQVVIQDSAGNRREFKSLDDVPPEMLKDLQSAMDAMNAAPNTAAAGKMMELLTRRFRRPYPFDVPGTSPPVQSPPIARRRDAVSMQTPLSPGEYFSVGPVSDRTRGKKRPVWMQWAIALLSLYGLYELFN